MEKITLKTSALGMLAECHLKAGWQSS